MIDSYMIDEKAIFFNFFNCNKVDIMNVEILFFLGLVGKELVSGFHN